LFSHLRPRDSEYDVKLGMYDGKKFSLLRAEKGHVKEMSEKKVKLSGLT